MKSRLTHCFEMLFPEVKAFRAFARKTFSFYLNKARLTFLALSLICFQALMSPLQAVAASTQEIITITGMVIDNKDSEPLPGVTILDNAKKRLGTSAANGSFTIRIPKGTEVAFNMIGYAPLKRVFNASQSAVTIRLATDVNQLNEVVVTALGIKREQKSLGYANTVVQGEQLTDAISSNWTDALSGKVAGLNLVRSNSGPTGSNKIILRGENNLTGDNEALIVVDGG